MSISIYTLIEVLGTITGLIYLYYSVNERIELWVWGFLSSFFAVLTFSMAQLYSEAILQVYYLIISVYGWYIWKVGVVENHESHKLTIKESSKTQIFSLVLVFIFIYLIILSILMIGPNYIGISPTQVPFLDCFCTTGSIIGTWMLSRKLLENWLVWVLVDFLGIGVSIYKELYFYAFLFFVYTVVAYIGYLKWRKLMLKRIIVQ